VRIKSPVCVGRLEVSPAVTPETIAAIIWLRSLQRHMVTPEMKNPPGFRLTGSYLIFFSVLKVHQTCAACQQQISEIISQRFQRLDRS